MSIRDDVRERIQQALVRFRESGAGHPRQRVLRAYETFRERFGPKVLASLDGEPLLSLLHDHGRRDSLVYWLEFKDDDEFPNWFGSILGGSALKFGIYRRKETGRWMAGHAHKQRVLETDEAVAIARKHRQQLVDGAAILAAQPRDPAQIDWNGVQREMERVAPEVAESAWGHKYFSLLAYDIIDDYHAVPYQRFHLLKLGIAPPEGRYRAAEHYYSVARSLDLLPTELSDLLNQVDGNPHRWVRLGTTDNDRSHWPEMRDGSYVAVGWNELGDLSSARVDGASKEAIKKALAEHGKHRVSAGDLGQQIFDFVAKLAPGDLVVAMNGGRHVLGIGRVTGDYQFVNRADEFAHRRPVEWLSLREWDLPELEPVPRMYRDLKYDQNIIAVERELTGGVVAPKSLTTKAASTPALAVKLTPLTGLAARIEAALRRKGQVILYGPPGTGKTHHAEEVSQELAARSFFGMPWSGLPQNDRKRLRDASATGLGAIETCCFHPAFGYEDFLEGFRPEASASGALAFARRDGVFKRLCERAARAPTREHFLIIDEINRGDVPRIFGELLTVLEKSRRATPITLPVSGETFIIPPNVFVLATMNTADRSIALLDAALRRRFAFVELMPDPEVLASASLRSVPLGPWLDSLNERIRKHLGRDGRNLQIGHSYLLDGGAPIRDFARFRAALRDEILPLLEEYCYERPDALHDIVGEGLYDRELRRFRESVLDAGTDDALVNALLAVDPDVTATRAAIDASDEDESTDEDEDGASS